MLFTQIKAFKGYPDNLGKPLNSTLKECSFNIGWGDGSKFVGMRNFFVDPPPLAVDSPSFSSKFSLTPLQQVVNFRRPPSDSINIIFLDPHHEVQIFSYTPLSTFNNFRRPPTFRPIPPPVINEHSLRKKGMDSDSRFPDSHMTYSDSVPARK